MKCPYCGWQDNRVIDSRESKNGLTIRRRRKCLHCGKRFTTYERVEEIPYMVIKKDGRREPFDRNKLLHGLLKACEKRPISVKNLEKIADEVELMLQEKPDKEISTVEIGQYLMERLKELDKVAYVRFASVYREFKDVIEFKKELENLLREK
ncbi:transcriptional regulator NrdR [Candidatus Aminicenantes bacterium AH-873-B07]|jgi:transcriptional repressor NrdR|nr:transcriptional regulator NrdR [Candidatus Aminicenantes bacterium AH-873-B07]